MITFLFFLFHLLIPANFFPLLFIVDCNYSDNHDGRGATLLLLSSWFTLWLPLTSCRFLRRDTMGAVKSLPESQPVPFLSRKPLVFGLFSFFGAVPIGNGWDTGTCGTSPRFLRHSLIMRAPAGRPLV